MDLKAYLNEKRGLVEAALAKVFPEPGGHAGDLVKAMRYSLFAGGKRLRPILCIAGAEAVGGEGKRVMPVACGLEMIHTYSLIHDDLPAMDNDDMRRGKPTSHKVYGEAVAILAGDGLLTEAFRVMSNMKLSRGIPAGSLLTVIRLVAEASGYEGMVAGQVTDIQSEGVAVEAPVVEFIHTRKTGALIAASVTSGAILGGGTAAQVTSIRRYGESIGLAFQIADDILDVEGDSEKMGKGVGGDARKKKVTYPSVFGLARSKEIQRELADRAIHSLKRFDHKADPLREIATYMVERKK